MAPTTFHLVSINASSTESFIPALQQLSSKDRPLWVGKCHHWIHQPHFSVAALTGGGPEFERWDYLLATTQSLPSTLQVHIKQTWSITAEVDDEALQAHPSTHPTAPHLPTGWSAEDHSGVDAAVSPSDLELSLDVTAYSPGSRTDQTRPIALKDFVRSFGSSTSSPIAMFNLLAYLPGQRERYFQYIAAFIESVGSKYGGEPIFFGVGVSAWSSREAEQARGESATWEDVGLIYYPSIWHFGKMLDDELYVDADRKYKQGVLKDNPLICCTEVKI